VIVARLKVPGELKTFGSAIVPDVVIVPPVKPVPAVMDVTPTAPPVTDTTTSFGVPERVMPDPADRVRTPVFETMTLPELGDTEIPLPPDTEVTDPPPPVAVISPVALLIESPDPTMRGPYSP
jgi:hypothetical protein